MKTPIIIDTDPGQDDAVAILLALASDELDVLGIVAVAGNVPLALTLENACKIVELSGRKDIQVYKGAAEPLKRSLVTAEHVHGKTGLDGPELPKAIMQVEAEDGVDFIIRKLRDAPENTISLCTLGPLTNIALALEKAPDITKRAKQIVMMGGGFFEGGNITPTAEFNIYVDPEAAKIVFQSGILIVMMPLDVTHKALTTRARTKRFYDAGTRPMTVTAELLDFFERFDEEKYGTDGGPLHDPTVIAFLLQPELFKGRHCNVEIETQSELTLGMSVIDWWGVTDRPKNALVMRDIDADGFFDLLVTRIGRL